MTEEEILKFIEEMQEHFGTIPNPEHHPKQFANLVKIFKYYKSKKIIVDKVK